MIVPACGRMTPFLCLAIFKEQAKIYYQKIITDYAGSLWINEARKRFRILRGDKNDGAS